MRFTKAQGLGNDFIILEEKDVPAHTDSFSEVSQRICNRHYGVGGDGMLLIFPHVTKRGAYFLRIFNSDGTEAETSGNGLRCCAAFLFHRGLVKSPKVEITTQAGWCQLELISQHANHFSFISDMGQPIFDPSMIPFKAPGELSRIVNVPLPIGTSTFPVTVLSMGNPHCVLFFESLEGIPCRELGPVVESHAYFPNKTNVEFVQVLSKEEMAAVFWERGAGETLSSGTGVAAAATAAILQGLVNTNVTVHTAGGDMLVEWREGEPLFVTGPAEIVFEGSWPDPAP